MAIAFRRGESRLGLTESVDFGTMRPDRAGVEHVLNVPSNAIIRIRRTQVGTWLTLTLHIATARHYFLLFFLICQFKNGLVKIIFLKILA